MASNNDFLEYVNDQLSPWYDLHAKRMFGVLGLYCEGLMFGIVAKDKAYLKVDETNKQKYIDEASKTLKVFKNDSEVPSYYEVPVHVLEDSDAFIEWAKESYAIQRTKNG